MATRERQSPEQLLRKSNRSGFDALAETTIGLFMTEAFGRGSPFLSGPLRKATPERFKDL
jgi:hypothetical protein